MPPIGKEQGLMSPKSFYRTEQSLASVMSPRRSSFKALHEKFTNDLSRRRTISFPASFNDGSVELAEPPAKRRRFQRRNSKTAAMLFSSMSSIIAADIDGEDEMENHHQVETPEDPWEGGLEIAEELVRQLKLRRKKQTSPSS